MTHNSSNIESIFEYLLQCFTVSSSTYHLTTYTLVNIPFVLPLCLYIFYLGVQQWRSGAKVNHTDLFTFNLVVIQIVASLGSAVLIINCFLKIEVVFKMCICAFYINTSAIVVFQILTCLDRYTAVVHPVTYLSLKSQTWALNRNLYCAFVWLVSIIHSICFMTIDSVPGYFAYSLLALLLSLVLMLFCNLCVLRALSRPRPGDGAKGNSSKCRALYTITAITGALLIKFVGDVFCLLAFLLTNILNIFDTDGCALYLSTIWFTLPSTLVLPLLFLHRNGKLLCF